MPLKFWQSQSEVILRIVKSEELIVSGEEEKVEPFEGDEVDRVIDIEEILHLPSATLTRIKGEGEEGEERVLLNATVGVVEEKQSCKQAEEGDGEDVHFLKEVRALHTAWRVSERGEGCEHHPWEAVIGLIILTEEEKGVDGEAERRREEDLFQ